MGWVYSYYLYSYVGIVASICNYKLSISYTRTRAALSDKYAFIPTGRLLFIL